MFTDLICGMNKTVNSGCVLFFIDIFYFFLFSIFTITFILYIQHLQEVVQIISSIQSVPFTSTCHSERFSLSLISEDTFEIQS